MVITTDYTTVYSCYSIITDEASCISLGRFLSISIFMTCTWMLGYRNQVVSIPILGSDLSFCVPANPRSLEDLAHEKSPCPFSRLNPAVSFCFTDFEISISKILARNLEHPTFLSVCQPAKQKTKSWWLPPKSTSMGNRNCLLRASLLHCLRFFYGWLVSSRRSREVCNSCASLSRSNCLKSISRMGRGNWWGGGVGRPNFNFWWKFQAACLFGALCSHKVLTRKYITEQCSRNVNVWYSFCGRHIIHLAQREKRIFWRWLSNALLWSPPAWLAAFVISIFHTCTLEKVFQVQTLLPIRNSPQATEYAMIGFIQYLAVLVWSSLWMEAGSKFSLLNFVRRCLSTIFWMKFL